MDKRPSSVRAVSVPLRAAVVATLAVVLTVASAEAHEKGVLKLASKTFRAGDSLAVSGEKFSAKDELTIVLIGANGRVALGDVPTDSAGKFRQTWLVPATIAAGQYRLVAEAIDGDEVASLDVAVSAPGAMAEMPGMEHASGHEGMQMDPTGAPLALDRARSSAVTGTAIAFIVVCAFAGVWLLRLPRPNPAEDTQ